MVAWYPFDDNVEIGMNLATGNTGMLQGPTLVAGKVKEALQFNGSDYVEAPSTIATNFGPAQTSAQCRGLQQGLYSTCLGDFSFDAWVKIPSTAPSDVMTILDKRSNSPEIQGYHWFLFKSSGNVFIGVQLADDTGVTNFSSGAIPVGSIYDSNFHYIAVTVSRSNLGVIRFYLDDHLIAVSSFFGTRAGSLVNKSPLRIGIRTAADPFTGGFVGTIDELEIYNRQLVPGEVSAIFRAGSSGKCKPPPPDPIQHPPSPPCGGNPSTS
jgi:hypothetical protein